MYDLINYNVKDLLHIDDVDEMLFDMMKLNEDEIINLYIVHLLHQPNNN